MSTDEVFDFVVVGSGSGGAAVAHRLSADGRFTVLLLEAGGMDDRPEIHRADAASVLSLLTSEWSPGIDWGYVTEPEKGLEGREVPIARGRVLGGSSSINALMWVRGNRADYDAWAALGNPGWSYDDVLPYFRRSETYTGPASTPGLRGDSGPVSVRALQDPSPVARAFVTAAGGKDPSAGFDYNGAVQEGEGFFYQTIRTEDNARSSSATAYLDTVINRPNLYIQVGAQASRLVIEDRRTLGVSYVQNGTLRSARARKEVVVSAGAFETPKLLMLSGIGPAEHLAEFGIPVVQDLPGVGRNLQDHPFVPVCFEAVEEHPADALLSEAGLFTRTPAAAPGGSPDLQFTFGPVKFLPPEAPADQWVGPGFTFAPIALLPRSRGEVRLADTDYRHPARVQANYLQDEADLDVLVHGVRLARKLADHSAFDHVRGVELSPGPDVVDDNAVRAFVRANASTLWHPVGTARMGTGPDAVVDARLRVHGIDGLRVADASVMPRIVAGNTHAPTVMIGEKAADLIAQSHGMHTEGERS
ncbi:GMC family oxidoreductase [Streptomyces sp. NPDC003697]